jgi:hypothetical protein
MKLSVFLTAAMSISAFVGVSMMDLSSMCHPSEEGQAMQDQIRMATFSKATTPAPTVVELFDEDAEELTWQTLSDVEFKDVYLEELDAYYWMPSFGPKVLASEGKDLYLTGYMIPVDVDEDFYVLSRYPFANCFFCGGAGPESVVDLRFPGESEREYQTDERLTFRGILRLNADDVYQMNYILDGAVEFTP